MAKKKENTASDTHTNKKVKQILPVPKGILIAIGGKENKGETPDKNSNQGDNENFEKFGILKRFVEECKGENPLIVVIPTASEVPVEAAGDYIKAFGELGNSRVEVADIRSREETYKPEMLELAAKADGIMFTGGDQLRLSSIFGGTEFLDILKDRYTNEPIVIAGTSAGATALSTPMIFEGGANNGGFMKGEISVATGLEFLKDTAIDTHFIARGRIVRMSVMISMNPGAIGIGLEEDTAIVVTNGKDIEVIGSGIVTIVDGHDLTYSDIYEVYTGKPVSILDLKLHFLAKGKKFCLNKRDQTFR